MVSVIIIVDSRLSLDVRCCSLPQRLLPAMTTCPVARSLSIDSAKTLVLVHAFVFSRLDYCNALLYGISVGLLRRIQSAQNAAA